MMIENIRVRGQLKNFTERIWKHIYLFIIDIKYNKSFYFSINSPA